MARGGRRVGAGRKSGVPNKATAEIREIARAHGTAAIEVLVALMKSENDMISVAACREILDRAYGKPTQAIVGDEGEAPIKTVMEIMWKGAEA